MIDSDFMHSAQDAAPSISVECILVADDLTGACDTGVQFVRRGLSCRVQLAPPKHPAVPVADILAFNTNSRGDLPGHCERKIEKLAIACSGSKANVVFKKVDSTLRGNVGQEIGAALRAFHCDAAIIAPAYPAMGRVVREGSLHWTDDSGSGQVEICRLLAEHGVCPEKLALIDPKNREFDSFVSELDAYLAHGKQFIVVNGESDDELGLLVAAARRLRRRFLWAGSAGLGGALADAIGKPQSNEPVFARKEAPIIFVIGSTHSATLRQRRTLQARMNAVEVVPAPDAITTARRTLSDRRHLVLSIDDGNLDVQLLHDFLAELKSLPVAAIFFTGGDTGASLCHAISAGAIDLRGEISEGFPWGTFVEGMFSGLPMACKSGGFGDSDALVCCARFFSSSATHE